MTNLNPEIAKAYEEMRSAVNEHFPALWPQLHAYLSALASLCWSDFPLPVTMIAIGPSGSGKTEPLMWIMRSELDIIMRSDSFTPKSFVTHAANIKRENLEKIDLLPRLKDHCFCTKELAPLFAGREDDLRIAFAQLTSVLDGEGLVSSSGTQGTRGYNEKIVFAWLGATTPPSNRIFAMMATLGTRLFFFSTDSQRPSAANYAAMLCGKRKGTAGRDACLEAVKNHLNTLFRICPIRSIPFESILIPETIADSMGLVCDALTRLRGGVSIGEGETSGDDRYGSPTIEHGWRAIQVLGALAKGSALIRGSGQVALEDYAFVRRVCLSSMPEYRRLTFEAILTTGGEVTALQVAELSGMSKKTALHYLKELRILGVIDGQTDAEPFRFSLRSEFLGLLENFTNTPADSVTLAHEHTCKSGNTSNAQIASEKSVTANAGVCEQTAVWDNEAMRRYAETFAPFEFNEEPDLPEGF